MYKIKGGVKVFAVDLHRHDEFSLFDGFGKPKYLARLAKSYGYEALSISNHGTVSGLVEHYLACKEADIKPILGVEVYFMPKFEKGKQYYHLCLFCKNLKGYQNLNRMLTYANAKNFYYKPIIDFSLLGRFKEGLICTSACVGGYPAQKIKSDKNNIAIKALKKFKQIFGEDFYIEIQPYKVSEKGLQEKVNVELMKMADDLDIRCVLTSDSHYGAKEDFDTYLKMHEIKNTKPEYIEHVKNTYGDRYMPKPDEFRKRFMKMHGDFKYGGIDPADRGRAYQQNIKYLVDSVEDDILGDLTKEAPVLYDNGEESEIKIKKEIRKGLKQKDKYNKKYWKRCMEELKVIKYHGFIDYFLIVQDYVNFAKMSGIEVGPGRGSVCNCLIAFVLGITDVDSIYFNLDFSRFMRIDKKKEPDIDIDFEPSRRGEVIDYLVKKYKNRAAQVCSFGLYKVDNLLNDLFKVCGVEDEKAKKDIKIYVKKHVDSETGDFNYSEIEYENTCKAFNSKYDGILKHFSKMYRKVRYIGTHAAGVAIVNTSIYNYSALEKHGEKLTTAYDLNNLESINVLKFDILGLRNLAIVRELRELTGESFSYNWLDDKKTLKQFEEGNTDAIFQFEREQAKDILRNIHADCIGDITAANALNRPGPLGLGMPDQYAQNKLNSDSVEHDKFYELTKDTYGTVVYQEQVIKICREIGLLKWSDIDLIMKMIKGERQMRLLADEKERIRKPFIRGAKKNGYSKEDAGRIYDNILTYSFNKGHALGYALIAFELMYYKVHFNEYFWFVNLKYAPTESDLFKYKCEAVKGGTVILTPHVNGTALYSLSKIDGEECIQEGLTALKGVGLKVAQAIEEERKENGKYKDIDDLVDRIPKRLLNSRVITLLKDASACDFNRKRYLQNVVKYNTDILSKRH